MDNGNISVQQLIEVFASIKFTPLPSEAMLRKLCKACEAFTTGERPYVQYKKILEAPSSREFNSINGIFPRIVRMMRCV